ncbi:P-II family nitrogen regulator [Extibacter muris]|uniref:P-II family nitrogen regulator n=1 Tax=Extibacter muris TaxID=1796622 RepID=UPI001D0873F2|nr:P-II family nitrogen regulator [Extibacter muris]MCB6203286.1 P-II family nitrogen regulator [Extibacter muris]MCQ4664882.1 P-II family nitrogen regulator [Extibacter muris]MCQ4694806.1 P-II family nitrogen regulator [Extibacter muris]
MSKLYMMVAITNRAMKHKFQEFYKENDHMTVFGTLGRGTANSAVLDYFGLEASEKMISFSVVTEEMWRKLKRGLIINMQIDVPGTGIAFIIPLSSVGGKKVLQYLIQNHDYEKEEETILRETDYELLVIIANQGCIDTVMDAARSANAGGGTVIHAKGTGMDSAEKFLGVSLAAEKEIILIVTKTKDKNQIMKAVMEKAGLESKEKAIVFSLPVTSTAGLRMREDEIGD